MFLHSDQHKCLSHNLNDGKARTSDVILNEQVKFQSLLLREDIQDGLRKNGFIHLSPIQRNALPLALTGCSIIVHGKSGTGKTLIFAVSALYGILLRQHQNLQCIVLSPTREIAVQNAEVIQKIGCDISGGGLKLHTFIGGVELNEDLKNAEGCQIAVGTPGRINHLIEIGALTTNAVRLLVLDEVDQLLYKEFQPLVLRIISNLPKTKQVIACSATLTEETHAGLRKICGNFKYVTATANDNIDTSLLEPNVLIGLKHYIAPISIEIDAPGTLKKRKKLLEILHHVQFEQCFVFVNYVSQANALCNYLNNNGLYAIWITSKQEQNSRLEVINSVKANRCRILVTTDLAARGIDVYNANLVINMSLPYPPISYLHRIGRAGRFGCHGTIITILYEGDEVNCFKNLVSSIMNESVELIQLPLNLEKDLISEYSVEECVIYRCDPQQNVDWSTIYPSYEKHANENSENHNNDKKVKSKKKKPAKKKSNKKSQNNNSKKFNSNFDHSCNNVGNNAGSDSSCHNEVLENGFVNYNPFDEEQAPLMNEINSGILKNKNQKNENAKERTNAKIYSDDEFYENGDYNVLIRCEEVQDMNLKENNFHISENEKEVICENVSNSKDDRKILQVRRNKNFKKTNEKNSHHVSKSCVQSSDINYMIEEISNSIIRDKFDDSYADRFEKFLFEDLKSDNNLGNEEKSSDALVNEFRDNLKFNDETNLSLEKDKFENSLFGTVESKNISKKFPSGMVLEDIDNDVVSDIVRNNRLIDDFGENFRMSNLIETAKTSINISQSNSNLLYVLKGMLKLVEDRLDPSNSNQKSSFKNVQNSNHKSSDVCEDSIQNSKSILIYSRDLDESQSIDTAESSKGKKWLEYVNNSESSSDTDTDENSIVDAVSTFQNVSNNIRQNNKKIGAFKNNKEDAFKNNYSESDTLDSKSSESDDEIFNCPKNNFRQKTKLHNKNQKNNSYLSKNASNRRCDNNVRQSAFHFQPSLNFRQRSQISDAENSKSTTTNFNTKWQNMWNRHIAFIKHYTQLYQ